MQEKRLQCFFFIRAQNFLKACRAKLMLSETMKLQMLMLNEKSLLLIQSFVRKHSINKFFSPPIKTFLCRQKNLFVCGGIWSKKSIRKISSRLFQAEESLGMCGTFTKKFQ